MSPSKKMAVILRPQPKNPLLIEHKILRFTQDDRFLEMLNCKKEIME